MSDQEHAAARRADYVRALRQEREGYVRMGREERVAEVDRELARFEGRPVGRSEAERDPAPESRKRATRKR